MKVSWCPADLGSGVGSVWDPSGIRPPKRGIRLLEVPQIPWDPAGVLGPFIILKGMDAILVGAQPYACGSVRVCLHVL